MKQVQIEKTTWVGKSLLVFDMIPSTNAKADEIAEEYPHGTVVIAGQQSAGKGRRGRVWESEKDVGIYMSILLKPNVSPKAATGFTLVTALAVAKAIERVADIKPGIKWPNDIVLNGKKICGILTEMKLTNTNIAHVVVGIGVNVESEHFQKEIHDMASSLFMETGKKISKDKLIEEILSCFEQYYEQYLKTEDFRFLQKSYEAYLVNKDKQVRVLDPVQEYEGIAKGITTTGELIVDTGQNIRTVYAGEVSVRGIYGYV